MSTQTPKELVNDKQAQWKKPMLTIIRADQTKAGTIFGDTEGAVIIDAFVYDGTS